MKSCRHWNSKRFAETGRKAGLLVILGIDPGVASTGYGIVKERRGGDLLLVDYGVITTPSKDPHEDRLKAIFEGIGRIIRTSRPDRVAIETVFYSKNLKSLVQVSEAIGVLSLAVCRHSLELRRFTPLEVKQAVVGNGRAKKNQVQLMVTNILNLDDPPTPDHASDALAVALCCAFLSGK